MDTATMKKKLIEILREKSLQTNVTRVLTSGRTSTYYIDAKMTTLDPEGARLVGLLILDVLKSYPVDAIGGYTLGADPIVSAVSVWSGPYPRSSCAKNPRSTARER
ncbi:MAG: hypothetical protein ACE5LV_07120 [Candidatus Aminicenantales bacterium]